jgi:hypothetical protein
MMNNWTVQQLMANAPYGAQKRLYAECKGQMFPAEGGCLISPE